MISIRAVRTLRRPSSGLTAAVAAGSILLVGCGQLHSKPADKYVYVTAKETYLRDRVAAVSNRTGNVENGEKLVVLDHARRFVKVRTPQGEIGWIDEKAVATQQTFGAFEELGKKHEKDPTVGNATVRDEANLHLTPGRDTDHFFLLAEGDKLQLLSRATLVKVAPPGGVKAGPDGVVPPPVMEDWWLVRDAKGHTGWLFSRKMDVDAPDTLVRYAEGQRIVGAYILTHVNDAESGQLRDGHLDSDIPIYVTVLSPYKAGLPYDFDQVRVFTWNLKKHRYETAFREKNIVGYLPVEIKTSKNPYAKDASASIEMPAFTYRVLAAEAPAPVPDPVTGVVTPGKTIAKMYRLEGNITRRIIAPGTQPPAEAHPAPEADKKDAKKKHKK
jgi:hypothetical protein